MVDYPIFLLPKGEIMMTAKVYDNQIILLKKTIFPSNNRYAISKDGIAACLDKEKKLVIYGQLNLKGDFENLKILFFPNIISPKSLCVVKNSIILGGENNHQFSNNINSHELIVIYSILEDKFIPVEMPFKKYEKCIDDLIIDDSTVLAVDNIVYPKFLLEYNFINPNYPLLIKSYSLPENGTYESIKKGTKNEYELALISSTFGMDGGGSHINIFYLGDYIKFIRLSQTYDICNESKDFDTKYFWSDIYLVPSMHVLLISSYGNGIGIYFIYCNYMKKTDNDDTESISYHNPWDKSVIKILPIPNDPEHITIIFEESINENLIYSYTIENIENLLESCRPNLNKNEDLYDDEIFFNQDNDSERDYFDSMTDGQLGNFDEFKDKGGDLDDIDTWSGS